MNVLIAIIIDILLLSVLALAVWFGMRSGFIKALSGAFYFGTKTMFIETYFILL